MKAHSEVLFGEDDWLFLREGNNLCLSYLVGVLPVPETVAQRWRDTLAARAVLPVPVLTVICPEKLAVFNEKLPQAKLDEGRLALRLAEENLVVYPVELLRQTVEGLETYSRTDTHFHDAGAMIVSREIASWFGVEWEYSARGSVFNTIGDLGNKLDPNRDSPALRLANRWPVEFHNNGLVNRGRVSIWHNPAAPAGRLLLFGDSFSGLNLAYMLSGPFREVVFVHSLSLDPAIFDRVRPDAVVFEFAERFLRVPADDGSSILQALKPKLTTPQRAAMLAWLADADHATWRYLDRDMLLAALIEAERSGQILP